MRNIHLPLNPETARELKAGDAVKLTGVIYTARDAAHKRLCDMISEGRGLPVELRGLCVYYCGPCPAGPGRVIGPCGPTTSKRMDAYAPLLYDRGVSCVIGKGPVSPEVKEAIIRNGCVYFAATGGAGALIARCVKSAEITAFEDLGAEAIRRLYVEDMPVIVAVDARGGDIFKNVAKRF